MLKRPLFSIIMPVYNAEKYLKKAILSVLNQSIKKIELIIVDDGSTDSSEFICKQYTNDNRVRYYKITNSGPLYARCFGAKKANGIYLLFCDADDFYLNKNCFKRLQEIVNSNPVDLIQFGSIKKYRVLRKKECAVKRQEFAERKVFYERDYPKLLCSFWEKAKLTICVWNKVYHRRLFDNLIEIDSFDNVFMGDDLILNLHILNNCQTILYSPEILYVYRANTGYSKKWSKKTMYDLNMIKSYQRQFLDIYKGNAVETIEEIMYSETAGWLLAHIIEGEKTNGDKEMYQYIVKVLHLQQFQCAKGYYLDNPSIQYPAVDLLRKGDPQKYIDYANKEANKNRLKKELKGILYKIV